VLVPPCNDHAAPAQPDVDREVDPRYTSVVFPKFDARPTTFCVRPKLVGIDVVKPQIGCPLFGSRESTGARDAERREVRRGVLEQITDLQQILEPVPREGDRSPTSQDAPPAGWRLGPSQLAGRFPHPVR